MKVIATRQAYGLLNGSCKSPKLQRWVRNRLHPNLTGEIFAVLSPLGDGIAPAWLLPSVILNSYGEGYPARSHQTNP